MRQPEIDLNREGHAWSRRRVVVQAHLKQNPGAHRAAAVARAVNLSIEHTTQILTQLERHGYISRLPSPSGATYSHHRD